MMRYHRYATHGDLCGEGARLLEGAEDAVTQI